MFNKEIDTIFINSELRIKIEGEIDHHSVKRMRERIDAMIVEKRPFVIFLDLSNVEFMDSSGLGLILGRFAKACDIGSRLVLYKPTKRIRRILELAGIEKLIQIEGDDDNEAC